MVLAKRLRSKPARLATILAQEVQAGRVVHEAGGYRLDADAFCPDVLEALRELSPS